MSAVERKSPIDDGGIRKVQVGVGPANARPDWWNVDIVKFQGVDELLDASEPWPWVDLLDYVYAEHFLEHLTIEKSLRFLVFAGRSLREGGKIRLSTPSLEWVLSTHFSFPETGSDREIEDTFSTNRAFHGWGHKFLYSKGMLQLIMSELGYENIEFFKYGSSETNVLKNLELHGGWQVDNGYPSVWIVEGTRGNRPVNVPLKLFNRIEERFSRYVRGFG